MESPPLTGMESLQEASAAPGTEVDTAAHKRGTRKRGRQEGESEMDDVRPSTRARKANSGSGTKATAPRATRSNTKAQGSAGRGKRSATQVKRR